MGSPPASLLQVSILLLVVVGGFIAYVYSTYKEPAPAAEEAPLSRTAAQKAAAAAANAAKAAAAGARGLKRA